MISYADVDWKENTILAVGETMLLDSNRQFKRSSNPISFDADSNAVKSNLVLIELLYRFSFLKDLYKNRKKIELLKLASSRGCR